MKERYTCTYCSKIVPWDSDSSTAYGCANPCDPEPYDPVFYCKKCAEKECQSFSIRLKVLEAENILEYHKPYWQMPNFILSEVEREVEKLIGVTDRHMTEEQYNDVHQSNAFINHISTIINNLRVK